MGGKSQVEVQLWGRSDVVGRDGQGVPRTKEAKEGGEEISGSKGIRQPSKMATTGQRKKNVQ